MVIGTYAPHVFISPLSPWPVVGSLSVIMLGLSLVEGFEDLARSRMDQRDNNRVVQVLRLSQGKIVEEDIKAWEIQSGDLVKIEGKTPVPVDMVVLCASESADGHKCLVETSNIDGETNLKPRVAPDDLAVLVGPDGNLQSDLLNKAATVEFEMPNADIHNFSGALHIEAIENKSVSLTTKNLLLRGSFLSNPAWVVGVAVYTGQETKVINPKP
mgnify:CR=1 FL=1